MGDGERREPRRFEPPPWEREQFERLERERAAQHQEAELEAALRAVRQREDAPVASENPVLDAPSSIAPEQTTVGPDHEQAAVERLTERMLIDLRLQEASNPREFVWFANIVSAALALGGVGFIVWAATAFARSQATDTGVPLAPPALAAVASGLMVLWGLMLMAGAILLWRKYNLK